MLLVLGDGQVVVAGSVPHPIYVVGPRLDGAIGPNVVDLDLRGSVGEQPSYRPAYVLVEE
jgi:hypothetical protein